MTRKLTFITVVFALAMCVLVVPATTASATDNQQAGYYNPAYDFSYDENLTLSRYYDAENDFVYEEAVVPQTNQIVRKYENPQFILGSRNNTRQSIEKTKKILATLGMSEDFIDELSAQRFNDYASGKSIEITTSYMMLSDDSAYPTYVSKEEAIENPIYTNTLPKERYLKMVMTALYKGDGWYLFSTDIEWLTYPPQERYEESLGMVMERQTLAIGSLENSWYSYEECRTLGENNTEYFSHKFYMTLYRTSIKGGNIYVRSTVSSYAAGMLFNYPEDVCDEINSINHTYFNFKAHLEAEAVVTNSSIPMEFNFAATYSHLVEEAPELETIDRRMCFDAIVQYSEISLGLKYTVINQPSNEVIKEFARFFAKTPTPMVYNPE